MSGAIVLVILLLTSISAQAVELGGGYNEQIGAIHNALILKSGVRWVRAYVNITRNYLAYGNPPNTPLPPPNPITGVVEGNLYQDAAHVSSDADVLAIAAVDQLINAKTARSDCQSVKVILSLKHDFTYPYPVTKAPPFGSFPATIAEWGHLLTVIQAILTTNNRGQHIDILVLGNEPMYEVQPNDDPVTGDNYAAYLNFLIDNLDALKRRNDWHFEIFVGALNRPSYLTSPANYIVPAVLGVLRQNPTRVAGIDLHEHVMDPNEAMLDIQLVKAYLHPGQKIISTEFSLIELWKDRSDKELGPWGAENGYRARTPLFEWINDLIRKAAAGQPVSSEYFMSYFNAQTWYPQRWFDTMMAIFEAQGVYAVTYGLEEAPRFPWKANELTRTALPWVLNAVYNGTIFGPAKDGYYNTNPLVYPEFRQAIHRMRHHRQDQSCAGD